MSGLAAMAIPFLHDGHKRELAAVEPAVVAERGYETIMRPSSSDQRPRERLRRLGIPSWATGADADFPGLLIRIYGPTGQRVSCQWKPRRPVRNRDGKPMKYASPNGQTSRLDVHPRNTSAMPDPTIPLWITEGVKKADALTSRGLCVVALSGVYNWRSQHGTLGDWEDVTLKGREVVVCFDSDARTNPNVARAMIRLGRWLQSKGAKPVRYLITPAEVDGQPVKGADDFLAAGGSLEELQAAATTTPPAPDIADDTFTDARLAETIADDVLTDRFIWVAVWVGSHGTVGAGRAAPMSRWPRRSDSTHWTASARCSPTYERERRRRRWTVGGRCCPRAGRGRCSAWHAALSSAVLMDWTVTPTCSTHPRALSTSRPAGWGHTTRY